MTAQFTDKFIFRGDQYSLIGIDGGTLALPEQFGMEPEQFSSACYRGFYAIYELTEEALYLRELTLREKNGNYLPIAGILPGKEGDKATRSLNSEVMGFTVFPSSRGANIATYHGLNVAVPFTGKIRLARDFINELYIHMGYQKATAFKTVLDITLKDGRVVEINDRSQEMEQKRGAFKKHYESGNTFQTIPEAFSLDMDIE